MLHWSQTLALTATINSHFRATCSSLINIFTLTQQLPGLTLPQRAQTVQCCGGRGVTSTRTRGCSQRGKNTSFNATNPKPPTLLKMSPGPLRTSGINKNPEAASPRPFGNEIVPHSVPRVGWLLSEIPQKSAHLSPSSPRQPQDQHHHRFPHNSF